VRFVPPPSPKTPKGSETRRRLLERAAALFIERGYAAVSMRDVAAAASLTKGAVYGHFRSKGQLLVEVIRSKLAAREHSLPFTELIADEESAASLMYDEGSGRQIHLLEVDAAAAARHDPYVEAGLADLYGDRQARLRAWLSEIVSDPEIVAWVASALSAGIAMKQAAKLPLPDSERLRTAIVAMMRSMI
jgi:AcrR family transcriptional regulator